MIFRMLFACLLSCCFGAVNAQQLEFTVRTVDYHTGERLPEMFVEVIVDNQLQDSYETNTSGTAIVKLDPRQRARIVISGTGKVERYFYVDTEELSEEALLMFYDSSGCVVSLFDAQEGVDYSEISDNPFTEFYFRSKSNNFEYDHKMADRMSKEIEKVVKQ